MVADFARTGATCFTAIFSKDDMTALGAKLDAVLHGRPGKRLISGEWTSFLPPLTQIASSLIGKAALPVRAVAFDKTPEMNWSVAWHQDRTIAVRERREAEGFGPWSTKDNILHVAPPASVLERMITLRLHVDDCDERNAPLKVAFGSHKLGAIAADEAAATAATCPLFVCHAKAGDVWAYATLILHASERSQSSGRRRVLQVDYAAATLPDGLEWLGI